MLPLEIRLRIYHEALVGDQTIVGHFFLRDFVVPNATHRPPNPIFRVTKGSESHFSLLSKA